MHEVAKVEKGREGRRRREKFASSAYATQLMSVESAHVREFLLEAIGVGDDCSQAHFHKRVTCLSRGRREDRLGVSGELGQPLSHIVRAEVLTAATHEL